MSKRLCSSGGGVDALERDIREFSESSELPDGLYRHVRACETTQAHWYEKLLNEWRDLETPPKTPEDGTKFVYHAMLKAYPYRLDVHSVDGILDFYGLPSFLTLPEMRDVLKKAVEAPFDDELKPRGAPLNTVDDEVKPVVEKNFPEFLLETLPVTRDQVTDGVSVTVFVEVPADKLCVLSSKIVLLVNERRKAMAKKDAPRASQLLNEINATEDYKMQSIDDVAVLTRKYEIRLRGIEVPGIETSEGIEAKNELASMIDCKCLTIEVFFLDDKKRCVGDVFCDDGVFLQGSLLDKNSAWEREVDEAQLKEWMERSQKWYEETKWVAIPSDDEDGCWEEVLEMDPWGDKIQGN